MLIKDGFSTDRQMGELTISDENGTKVYPTYTCAHCNTIVVMRPDRQRPRQRCLKCFGILCEKGGICKVDCTPLYALSRDHFEGAGIWGKWVNPIMFGINSVQEAHEKGLVLGG